MAPRMQVSGMLTSLTYTMLRPSQRLCTDFVQMWLCLTWSVPASSACSSASRKSCSGSMGAAACFVGSSATSWPEGRGCVGSA